MSVVISKFASICRDKIEANLIVFPAIMDLEDRYWLVHVGVSVPRSGGTISNKRIAL